MKPSSLTPWQVLERRPLVERSYLTVWEDRVRLGNGREIDDFCILDAPDWAAVVCVTAERQIVLVRQYRHGVRAESIELPAGALEPGEEPSAAARRELLEETGYEASEWAPLMKASLDPARQSGWAHFFFASGGCATSVPRLDASEEIEVLLVSKAELFELIDAGRLVHGIHLAAIALADRRGLL